MPYTEAAKNAMLDGTYTPPTHVAAFEGDPTAAGEELDRVAIAWDPASGGEKEQDGEPVLEIAAGKTVNHLGYFSAASGGTLLFWDSVTPETFGNDGTYRVTSSLHDLNLEP